MDMASKRFPGQKIHIPATCKSIDDEYTMTGDNIIFWFNSEDGSTHIVKIANR